MEYLIGLDIGTTSTKAVAFDFSGNILKLASAGYPLISPHEGWFEQNPDLLLASAEKAVREITSTLKQSPVTVSISCAMHGLLLVDNKGKPLTNIVIWADSRSKLVAEALRSTAEGRQVYLDSGTPVHAMSPLCKLIWLKSNEPELMQKSAKYISIKEYLLKKWMGEYILDESLASATGLFNIHEKKWNERSLQLAGIKAEQLPAAVPGTTVLKGLKESVRQALGFSAETTVVVGASDGCLANLGSGVMTPGMASLTIGTSSAFRKTTNATVKDEKQRVFNYILSNDLYVVGGPSNNGGVVAEWFQKQFCDGELHLGEIASAPPGSQGLLFLPYLLGERAPMWDAEARGVFFGVHMNHTKAHFARAVWEGIFLAVQSIAASVEEVSGAVEKVVVSGGFARSPMLVQMAADMLNKPLLVCESAESSAYGAALLGMHAIGVLGSLADAQKMMKYEEEILPDATRAEIYRQMQSKFGRLYEKLKDEF